jgi:hypothetical protein
MHAAERLYCEGALCAYNLVPSYFIINQVFFSEKEQFFKLIELQYISQYLFFTFATPLLLNSGTNLITQRKLSGVSRNNNFKGVGKQVRFHTQSKHIRIF